jgi:hypothetical protein
MALGFGEVAGLRKANRAVGTAKLFVERLGIKSGSMPAPQRLTSLLRNLFRWKRVLGRTSTGVRAGWLELSPFQEVRHIVSNSLKSFKMLLKAPPQPDPYEFDAFSRPPNQRPMSLKL